MERTCPNCGSIFAHASSLSRHKKDCGGGPSRLPCPHCSMTFTRAGNLQRHVQHSCKGTKRPAAEELSENPLLPEMRPLVDYSSSEEEVAMDVDTYQPATSYMTEQLVHPFGPWRAAEESEEESSDEEESEDEEPRYTESSEESWHTAEEEEPWASEETSPHTEEPAPLSLDTLKKALPWAQYRGVG